MTSVSRVYAPFSHEQVESLNDYQKSGLFHEFTCGGEHEHAVVLVATGAGWVCPEGCGYLQIWAHPWMADGKWRRFGGDD